MRLLTTQVASATRTLVVMNSFNRAALLESALASIRRSLDALGEPARVVVFDAGSSDGSLEIAARAVQDAGNTPVTLLAAEQTDDTSFAAGCNQAAVWGGEQAPSADALLFFETDNYLKSEGPLGAALSLLRASPRVGAVGFTVERHDGTRAAYGCTPPTAFELLLGQRLCAVFGLGDPPAPAWRGDLGARWAEASILFTSPLLVRLAAWHATQGMDASLFPFTDSDVDWSWRARRAGWELRLLAADGVVHDNRAQPSAWSARRVLLFHQSRLRLLRKHGVAGASLLPPLLFLRHLAELAVLGIRARHDARARAARDVRRELLATVFHGYAR